MAKRTVAEQLLEVLLQYGVKRIYGVVGDSLNPLVDAIRRSGGKLEWVHVRNEEAAAFAAAAEAQLTGSLAVCAGSCGPGNTHLVQGLYDAKRSGAPVLAIAAHIPSHQIGSGFFQETHPEQLFAEAADYVELISQPEQMPRIARIAAQQALGAGSVSVLVLPGDIADKPAANPTGRNVPCVTPGTVVPPESAVRALADLVNGAKKVAVFAGAGVRDAHAQVMRLAETVQAPVGHTLRGKEWIQFDNPFDVGMIGLLGYGACYDALHEADLVLLLGTDFPYDAFLPQAHTVQIDRDATRLGRRTPLELGVHGDVAATLDALQRLLRPKRDRRFLDAMLTKHERALTKVVEAYARDVESHVPIHPEYAARVLDEIAADDAVFTVDTGMNNVWAARYLTPNGRRRVIGSFSHGTMANALPHAIGAAFTDRRRQVISLSGDGGLSMLLGELITVGQHDLAVKTVVFNNASLGMVRLEMLVDGLPAYETDHAPVDYAAIARGIGMPSWRVEKPTEVEGVLREALGRPGPALVELVTDPNALSIPSHVTASQVAGFALAAGRTVLDGGVGTMLDLARSNLRNIPRP
ncbi:Pyruvate dehydrogenase [ubiquinone] [Streptomyces sp. RB5]|uniref:Pyruvate dehydrogenase [ubiquinone] n=1 Tax=Streptomyces smaragdinus TaxID=2585196 RepID=A0A7K0CNX1_9ACTN|nr:pyruvate dehydrogenase [Streptomyces smaragdinus]MQY14732.1 Pyruvate dehydrogenase [ubiquinone] [Streptomyces smaragdinus]